jgi:hypothetical protein
MMPRADLIAAHDAALTDWSSPGSGSARRAAVRANDDAVRTVNARTSPASGWVRTAVLQGALVESAPEGLGALPSLLDADAPGVRSPHAKARRPSA